ncbi:hypothetical protein V1514DRAFT_60885 [Lipomyces japonicus]|uniref:uncharacterized protein n=1 Tax=Lipomyces japonicus TaxID=56871 RepID=UPI0034CE70B6
MSYSSHRGINVSQYIAHLNSLEPSDFPPATSSKQQQDDLSLFANTQFFDFDMGRSTDAGVSVDDLLFDHDNDADKRRRATAKPQQQQQQKQHLQPQQQQQQQPQQQQQQQQPSRQLHQSSHPSRPQDNPSPLTSAVHTPPSGVKVEFDFLNNDYMDYQMPVLAHGPPRHSHAQPHHHQPNPSNPGHQNLFTPLLAGNASAAATGAPGSGPASTGPHTPIGYPSTPGATGSITTTGPSSNAGTPAAVSGIKRASSVSIDVSQLATDDASRLAAEEDKRRRNTAASARFRIKKKQREQQMERTAKDLQDKVQSLEAKIMQLEMENKWLKNLVVEKNETKSISDILSRGDKQDEQIIPNAPAMSS